MSASPLRLAVIILSYNTRELLQRCLQSVFAAAEGTADHLAVDVLVIDNASHDDSAAMVATQFPQAHLIPSPTNLGYTGGNNLGLQYLGLNIGTIPQSLVSRLPSPISHLPSPDFILILNADTEVATDALGQMANFLATHPAAGACGAKLTYGDGSFQHGAFAFPTLFQLALDLFPLTGVRGSHRLHHSQWNGRYAQQQWQGTEPFPVDFALGAALMVRYETVAQIGGFDEGYFLYCEEIDWCLRMKLAGWQIYAVPTAAVIHYEGQSSRQVRWPAFVRLWRSRLRFYAKYQALYPPGTRTILRWLLHLGMWWRIYQSNRHFAQGKINGTAWVKERAAYAEIKKVNNG